MELHKLWQSLNLVALLIILILSRLCKISHPIQTTSLIQSNTGSSCFTENNCYITIPFVGQHNSFILLTCDTILL
jgi:hypothetical protein